MDLIKAKMADVMAQQRANRQFEEIGEKVAENLLPVFEIEGAHLDESSCTAVALAVSETLNRSPIDAELLAMRDFDPTKLMMHLLYSHPSATQAFSTKDLVETYKEARFIVSSRPHAVEEGWMEREGFDDAELQPMELTDIFAFIDHWHDAVREALRDDIEKDELTSLAEHLKEVVRHSRPLRSLAINPLLCAMLCALHRDRRQQLPSDRIELYEAGCQMLLERRDIERRIALHDYPHLSYRQKRALLQDFAY